MIRGSCLCGAVRYEYTGPTAGVSMCHCRQCQKAQGSAFAAIMPIDADAFRVVSGSNQIREYNSSADKYRAFCSRCGSPLYSRKDGAPEVLRLRVGTIDEPAALEATFHKFYDERASWFDPDDDLERFPGQA